MTTPKFAAWFSTPNVAGIEIVARAGYDTVIFDVEHGSFDLADLNRTIPFVKALGMTMLVKVGAPERSPIQQALDFGADGVIIPHILGVAQAAEVCGLAKLPPLGDRSLAGGRTMDYIGFDAEWAPRHNRETLCLPMIEDPAALDDVEAILALDVVDGVFVGPGDLFARRGGGGYVFDDVADASLRAIARAARAAGKPWMMPAWSETEQRLAIEEGAHTIGVLQEFTALRLAFSGALASAKALAS
ncbi:HpcH/HpaI aldolase family protein [Agrococcus jejuensis]|uniref:HpcH/HpaI aldolase family protein n=1 Tax=Agrococcus jejuensis TaxID=399736 RepID=UPI0011A918D3|nr:aldolase/citrate lyase family protein [Agrococcus jejuensis]